MAFSRQSSLSKWKTLFWRFMPHIVAVVIAYGYMVFGGYLFCLIEGFAEDESIRIRYNYSSKITVLQSKAERDIHEIYLKTAWSKSAHVASERLDQFAKDVHHSTTMEQETNGAGWNLLDGFLYAFYSITTIGYSHLATKTDLGRIFYVFFGVIGIPLFSLAMADIGMFLEEFMWYLYTTSLHLISTRFNVFRSWKTKKMLVPAESLLALPIVMIIFTLYTVLGGFLFPLWETAWGFVEAFYVAFDTITTIGIGDLYPHNNQAFMATVIYISVGFAVGCVAIGALSDYIKVVHFWGTQPSDCGMQVLWFGGKHMRVSEFVKVIGKELDATEYEQRSVEENLDKLINEAFEEKRRSRASSYSKRPKEVPPRDDIFAGQVGKACRAPSADAP